MPHSSVSQSLRRIFVVFACLTPLLLQACSDEKGALQSYNAAIGESSVSGISSGGFMALVSNNQGCRRCCRRTVLLRPGHDI